MSGTVLIAAIAAIVVVVIVIVISMCVLADRLARIPDSKVSITDTGGAIGAIVGAVIHAVVTIFTGRS
jgi:hypothetical protein